MNFRDMLTVLNGSIPRQLVLQYTDRCNAGCPQCNMRVNNSFKRSRLDIDVVKRIIDVAAKNRFRAVSFTGGEPLLYLDDLAALIRYAGKAGIRFIRTGANGFFFANPDRPSFTRQAHHIASALADTPLRNFWISMDSAAPDVHEQMRGLPGVVAGIEKALPIFHSHGVFPSVNLGINRNAAGLRLQPRKNMTPERLYETWKRIFRTFYRRVVDMGFTIVNTCYPMGAMDDPAASGGLSAVYAATSTDDIVNFSRTEKAVLFKALYDVIPAFRSEIRIFSPLISLRALQRQYAGEPDAARSCHGGIDFFFIDAANADVYPCGYRGDENLGKFWSEAWKTQDKTVRCVACDWECFRDPSELFGPLLRAATDPIGFVKHIKDDPGFGRFIDDVLYYRACDLFDGRKPPNDKKLRRFKRAPPLKNQLPRAFMSPQFG